jgi:hypothetical protein
MAFSAALSATEILQSFEVAYETIRERKAAGGPGWNASQLKLAHGL